jgi:nucleoside-diphosphate-sugar epimerase
LRRAIPGDDLAVFKALVMGLRDYVQKNDVADVFVAALDHPRAVRATFEIAWNHGARHDSLPTLLDQLTPDAG